MEQKWDKPHGLCQIDLAQARPTLQFHHLHDLPSGPAVIIIGIRTSNLGIPCPSHQLPAAPAKEPTHDPFATLSFPGFDPQHTQPSPRGPRR